MEEYKPKSEDLSELTLERSGESAEIGDRRQVEVYDVTLHDPCAKADVLDYGDQCFLLKHVMSPEECQHYISQGENIGFEPIPGVNPTYRNSDRIVLESQQLSDRLWTRIKPYLEDKFIINGDPHSVHVHGVSPLLQGEWVPSRINPIFRLCRYKPGGHFAPHFDGHLVVSSEERSFKTCMLYLNGDFQGGSTNFVDQRQTLYMDESGKYCAEEKNILQRIQPEGGLAIIFNHHRLHEGGALTTGMKYILRTDIMYKRVGGSPVDRKDEQALQVLQEAERLEGLGESMEAMKLYRRAFKLSPSLAESFGS